LVRITSRVIDNASRREGPGGIQEKNLQTKDSNTHEQLVIYLCIIIIILKKVMGRVG
jgi:hypothetical protein